MACVLLAFSPHYCYILFHGPPPPPSLRDSQRFRRKLLAHPQYNLVKSRVRAITRSNTVLHANLSPSPRAVHVATLLGSPQPLSRLMKHPHLQLISAPEASSPFSHRKFTTSKHGRLLLFGTGNLIRAGKHTHGDAVRSVLSFVAWAGKVCGSLLWPTSISCPNTVCSSQYTAPISPSIREHWRASYSPRFPGISFTFPDAPGVTTELFLKQSKWIAPGVQSPEALVTVAVGMAKLYNECGTAADCPSPHAAPTALPPP